MAHKIAVISGKGGVGKTTISANLGSTLAHVFDREVTVIDTDVSSSHLGIHLGFHYNPATINSVLRGEHDVEESIYEHDTGVNVVAGALNYEKTKDIDVSDLVDLVEEFERDSDIVLLDCSPGLDRETSAALQASDEALYVSRPSFTSVIDVVRTQSMVEELGRESIGVVLNMVKGRKHEITRSEIEGFTDLEVVGEIPYDETLEQSAAQGTPVTVMDPHSKASRAIEDLAVDVIGEDPAKKRDNLYRRMRRLLPRL
ncbi:MAG: cell division ATPase MinD [Candidatus Nanohaloarchaea archaeon]|nr:cell division ATPase MinD [Candidatus Nanohaloarchaea archaeon]